MKRHILSGFLLLNIQAVLANELPDCSRANPEWHGRKYFIQTHRDERVACGGVDCEGFGMSVGLAGFESWETTAYWCQARGGQNSEYHWTEICNWERTRITACKKEPYPCENCEPPQVGTGIIPRIDPVSDKTVMTGTSCSDVGTIQRAQIEHELNSLVSEETGGSGGSHNEMMCGPVVPGVKL